MIIPTLLEANVSLKTRDEIMRTWRKSNSRQRCNQSANGGRNLIANNIREQLELLLCGLRHDESHPECGQRAEEREDQERRDG